FQAEDGIRDGHVTGVQTCALPIFFRTSSGFHSGAGGRKKSGRSSKDEIFSVSVFIFRVLMCRLAGIDLAISIGGRLTLMKTKIRSEERRVGKERRIWWESGRWSRR